MADVSEDMDTHDLKSLTFLLRDTLPKHKLQNIQVSSAGTFHLMGLLTVV